MTNFVRLRDVDYILDTLVDSQKQMLILGIYVRHVTHHGNMKQKVMRMRLRLYYRDARIAISITSFCSSSGALHIFPGPI